MTRFDTFLAAVLEQAGREARDDGSSTVEAHHVLLAIAGSGEPSTGRLLSSVGLDQGTIREALGLEFEHSLAAAGVSLGRADVPRPNLTREPSPPLGSSVKLALERGLGATGRKRDLRPAHLLIGILRAPVGTVPRALALAGVDRATLVERTRRAIASEAYGRGTDDDQR